MTRWQKFVLALDRLMFGSKLAAIRKAVEWQPTEKPRSLERGSFNTKPLKKAA